MVLKYYTKAYISLNYIAGLEDYNDMRLPEYKLGSKPSRSAYFKKRLHFLLVGFSLTGSISGHF